MLVAGSSDSAVMSDSARAYKSVLAASSLPVPSDSARWGSARAASDSSSPYLADSALARTSSVVLYDSPSHSDSARAGASARLLHDSPALIDGAATGSGAQINAGDVLSVSDSSAYGVSDLPAMDPGTAYPAGDSSSSGGGAGRIGAPVGGSGSVGIKHAAIHAASYERCSDEPRVTVIASPPEIAVTVEQSGTRIAAQPSGRAADAPNSSVWAAPLLPDAQRLHIQAVLHRGGPATGDYRHLDMDSCSGSVRYTEFGAPVAEQSPERDELSQADPPARLEPAAEPPARAAAELGVGAEPALTPETKAAPPAPGPGETAGLEDAPIFPMPEMRDLTREPPAEAPATARQEPAALEPWHAAAAVLAAAALLAVLEKRRRSTARLRA